MEHVARIEVDVEINAASDKVWEIISDIDSEPIFWKGTKKVRNISRKGNEIIREVTIAFRDQKCIQKVVITPKSTISAEFTKGILDGQKIISLRSHDQGSILTATWDIKLTGMMGMFSGMLKKHIQSGTEQALQSIKKQAEL